MQGIYTHIPETNYVPREYSVAAEPFRTQHPRSECSKVVLPGIVHWVEHTQVVE